MHRPPDLTLPATPVNAPAPEWMTPITTTSRPRGSGMFGNGTNRQLQQVETSVRTQGITRTVRQEFETKSQALPTNLDAEISSHRSQYPNSSLSAVQAWQREVDIREALRTRKTAELAQRTTIANAFFGSDPRDKSFADFVRKATTIDTLIWPGARSTQLWEQSFLAAHEAQLLRQSIALLQQQSATAHVYLKAAQNQEQAARVAAEQARVAAEQAQQLAAQRSRIAAEQKRQKELAEAAHGEQTRLAALAEAQRLAKERARTDAETRQEAAEKARLSEQRHQQALAEATRRKKEEDLIRTPEQTQLAELAKKQELAAILARYSEILTRLIAEARGQSQERSRIAATKTAVDGADSKAEATEQQLATEKPQPQTKPEQPIEKLQQQERRATEVQHVYPANGALASNSPAVSFASKATHLPPATSSAILTSLRAGLLTVRAAGAALISGPVLVGFAALLMPSRLGNGERFSMSVPLAELSPESPQTLREIADRQGTLELPVGLGVRRVGAGAEIFVATSDDFHIRSSVLVLNAAYDLLNDVYEVALPDSPTDFLTWTPAISPDGSSTESPIVDTDATAYTGAPIVPIEGRLDLNPILVEGWERFIIVFPDDSGVAPLYVVFSSPYAGGYVKGKYSGRTYNPEQSGGPILDLDWRTAVITQAGVTNVKLHVARFNQSDANDIMIQRLERILKGDLSFTDTDLRYYTHELRELERYRNFGYSDDTSPSEESTIWNNAHTATLEDYKLGSELTLLYNEEAVNAMNAQDEREYQNDMRSFAQ